MSRVLVLALLVNLALAGNAGAQRVRIAWGSPDGPEYQPFVSGPVDVYVTLTGQSAPIRAIDLRLQFTTHWPCPWLYPYDFIPDAWRFDAAGCQAGRACLTARGLDPTFPAPPPPDYLSISRLTHDDYSGAEQFLFAEIYPAPVTTEPSHTYVLLHLRLDHTHSVAGASGSPGQCGGGEAPMYVVLTSASWLDASDTEAQFLHDRDVLYYNTPPITVKGPVIECSQAGVMSSGPPFETHLRTDVPVCDLATPGRASTWGKVKASYR